MQSIIKHFQAILLISFISFQATAQKVKTDANINGDVQCKGEHVPFINVTIDGSTIGTTTDGTGHYQLVHLPVGTHTVRVNGMGYKPVSRSVTVSKNSTTEVRFEVEEDVFNIEGVVVTADRNQTNRSEASVIVTSLSPKMMAMTQSVNIAEGLSFIPGLRTETNCQNCGFTQIRMNGMAGPYTQILMNSRSVFSGLAGVYGLELIPANMVERMEVVRGGGSALFGGNAIAGTVNIITREPALNSFSIDGRFGAIGIGGGSGPTPALDGQLNMNASVITDDRKTGGTIYSMMRNRGAYDANGDDFSEMVEMENTTFGFSVFHKPGQKSKISLDGYRINEFRRGGNKLDYLPHEADVAERLDHLITGANLTYDLFTGKKFGKLTVYASAQHVNRGSYYGAQQDPNAYGHTNNLTSSIGSQYTLNAKKFLIAPSSTAFGFDNTNDYLHDVKLGTGGKNNTTLINQSVNTMGTFIQHDWKMDKLNVSLGLRYDFYSINDRENEAEASLNNGVFVPRVSLMYKLKPDLRLRVGYAQGYRPPQVFNEDLHIELVNATRVQTFNSNDLVQERSNAYTSSLNSTFNLGSIFNDLLIEGFYTLLKNPFTNKFYPLDDQGNFAYMRINAEDGAYVSGISMEWKSILSEKLETQLGFTFQKSKYQTAQTWGEEAGSTLKYFMRTPNQYGYATLIWKPTHHFNTTLALNYTGPMYVPHFGVDPKSFSDPVEKQTAMDAIARGDIIEGDTLKKSDSDLVADLLFSYDLHFSEETTIQFYAGVKNIFNQTQNDYDKGVYRDAGYVYGPSLPRTFNIGIKFGNLF
jgi:outer membrane receptor for ferrienterochelin and colicins